MHPVLATLYIGQNTNFSLTVNSGNSGSGIAGEGTTQPTQVIHSTATTVTTETNGVTTGSDVENKATENEINSASNVWCVGIVHSIQYRKLWNIFYYVIRLVVV